VTLDPDIHTHYRLGFERARLREDGRDRLEFVRTWELLERHLPPPPARVLDIGGGPGTYALPLRDGGYDVELLDPVPLHVEQAGTGVVGDARELPFADASADAVLLLGPLYHLIEAADRVASLRETVRVLRPGGVVAAATISRLASTFDGFAHGYHADPVFAAMVDGAVRDGIHRNPDPEAHPEWFTTAYFHTPEEIRAEFEAAGLAVTAQIAVEGPGGYRNEVDEWLGDDRREAALTAIRRVETDPAVLATSSHLLTVGRA
jgi:ubiquinone/menaquinone biosynthesis C-methylase UbiE